MTGRTSDHLYVILLQGNFELSEAFLVKKPFSDSYKESEVEYQTRSMELSWTSLIGGLALGALAMYVTDPSQGRRRRALLQDKMTSATHKSSQLMSQTLRDTRNRLTGLQAEAKRMMASRQAKPIDDHVLEARVRSRLGRAMPQLHGVEVTAEQGLVTLSGNIPQDEEDRLIDAVEAIPGVEGVRCHWHWREARHRSGMGALFAERSPLWVAGALGAGLLTWYGLSRRQPLGLVAAATSLGLMARGHTMGVSSAASSLSGAASEGFEAERTIEIAASPEVVFDVWSRYENFPHFMSHVIEVRDLGQNRSHWVVQGPAGTEVEFDSVLTASDRPHRLVWQSEPGATVDNEGMVMLEPLAGGTRATVRMSWRPPAGGVGKGVAVLMGTDPETSLEEDLRRMKQFIERGLPAREGEGSGTASGRGTILH